MTRITALLFAVALTLNACATAGPIAIKCGLQDVVVAANDYAEIKADVQSKNWTDLAKLGESLGWATLDCVLGNEASKSPAVKANVDEFRRLHSVEFRAAGGSACNPLRGGPEAGHQAHNLTSLVQFQAPQPINSGAEASTFRPGGEVRVGVLSEPFAYAGPNPGAALAHCYRQCGDNVDALAPPGGCECWRKVGSTWRWVAMNEGSVR